jgi:hypothetical protein
VISTVVETKSGVFWGNYGENTNRDKRTFNRVNRFIGFCPESNSSGENLRLSADTKPFHHQHFIPAPAG